MSLPRWVIWWAQGGKEELLGGTIPTRGGEARAALSKTGEPGPARSVRKVSRQFKNRLAIDKRTPYSCKKKKGEPIPSFANDRHSWKKDPLINPVNEEKRLLNKCKKSRTKVLQKRARRKRKNLLVKKIETLIGAGAQENMTAMTRGDEGR